MFAGWKKLDGWARKKLGRRVHSLPDRTAVNCLLESLIDQCRESGLTLPPNFGAAELRTRTRAWMGDNGDVVLDGDWREGGDGRADELNLLRNQGADFDDFITNERTVGNHPALIGALAVLSMISGTQLEAQVHALPMPRARAT
jgi:hypothetical protein